MEKPPCDDWFADVLEFMDKFRQWHNTLPATIPKDVAQLRRELMLEEQFELHRAMKNGDLPSIADGVVDLIYVAIGTAIAYGIDIRPVWSAVQKANMEKVPYNAGLAAALAVKGIKVPIGKVLKPEGWQPPNIVGILEEQQPL